MRQADLKSAAAVRQAAMAVLAAAPAAELSRLWAQCFGLAVAAETLRGPETGLVTVRGRIGGGGPAFNIGETTVTRATVRLATGEVGHCYMLGRDGEKARLAATIDALLQRFADAGTVEEKVIAPLRRARDASIARRQAQTAATKVDFFTLVRGED